MKLCDICGSNHETSVLYGYSVCSDCLKSIGLYKDKTIIRHIQSFDKQHSLDPALPTYSMDARFHLEELERMYIKKKIKLLHILDRIDQLSNEG